MKKAKKLLTVILSLAVVVASVTVPGRTEVRAAELDDVWLSKAETVQTISGGDLEAAGVSFENIKGCSGIVAYVKVTKCSPYSCLKISGVNTGLTSSNSSNKCIKGSLCTKDTNPFTYLHAASGDGKGENGSGIYKCPAFNLKNPAQMEDIAIYLRYLTSDVEARIVGVAFNDSGNTSVSVAADGTVTMGYTPPADLENTEREPADKTPEQLQQEEEERFSQRDGLRSAIDYCMSLQAEDYEAESFSKLAPAIEEAEKAYESEEDTRENYKEARDALETVRTALVPKISAETDSGDPSDFRFLSKEQTIREMGAGINLGNTMDGGLYEVTETSRQSYKTTKEYIRALHDAGYNTVRVPVTWGQWIRDDYSIDETWIGRVKEIVDYCVEQDMYCIINIQNDGAANQGERGDNADICWLDSYAADIEKVYQKYEGVWKTIAVCFRDYDEHLIFEGMNEVTDAAGTAENEDTAVLNSLNQLFVNTVRATGSNNTKRWLAITGRMADCSEGMQLPEDKLRAEGAETTRLMFAVHIYNDTDEVRRSYDSLRAWQEKLAEKLKKISLLSADMPVYIGEYGVKTQVQQGTETGYNNAERALNYEMCTAVAGLYHVAAVAWDEGALDYDGIERQTGLCTDWNRPALKPVYDDVVQALIRGTYEAQTKKDAGEIMADIYKSYGHGTTADNGISKDPEIKKAASITADKNSVTLLPGEREKIEAAADSPRDIVLWSTDDDSVATVSQGEIHAKALGRTTVHAYTQSGSVKKDIPVFVGQKPDSHKQDHVKAKKNSIVVAAGRSARIELNTEGAGKLTAKSSDARIKADISGNTLIIRVDKKATKGASYRVTVHRGEKSDVVTVIVRNKAKAVRAAKKKAVIKKKGKTAKITIKITKAENKKMAVTDKITVKVRKKKIVKFVSAKKIKGRVVIALKGLKKGKTRVTVKVGSKAAGPVALTVKR